MTRTFLSGPMLHSIVIIAAAEDRDAGRAIAQWLIARSIPISTVKYDPAAKRMHWPKGAAAALVLVSPNANNSRRVQAEARHAQKLGLTIITLCLTEEPPRGALYSPDDWPYLVQSNGTVRQRHLRQVQSHAVTLLRQAGAVIDMVELASDGTIALNDDNGDDLVIVQVKQPQHEAPAATEQTDSNGDAEQHATRPRVPLESIDEDDPENQNTILAAWRQTSRRDKAIVLSLLAAAVLLVGMMSQSIIHSIQGPGARMQDVVKSTPDRIIQSLVQDEAQSTTSTPGKPTAADQQAGDEALASRMASAEQRASSADSTPSTGGNLPRGGGGGAPRNASGNPAGAMPSGMNAAGSSNAAAQSFTPQQADQAQQAIEHAMQSDQPAAQNLASLTDQLKQMAQQAAEQQTPAAETPPVALTPQQAEQAKQLMDAVLKSDRPIAEAARMITDELKDMVREAAAEMEAKAEASEMEPSAQADNTDAAAPPPPGTPHNAAPTDAPPPPSSKQQIDQSIAEVMQQIESESASSTESKALRQAVKGMQDKAARKIDALTKQIDASPANAEALRRRAAEQLQNGDAASALADAQAALAKNAGDTEASLLAGQALRAMGQSDDAIKAFEKAIADAVHAAEGHTQRGEVMADLERYESALADFKAALRIDANHAEALVGMARVRALQGNNEAAVDLATTAIERKPQLAAAYTQRGSSLTDLHRYRGAVGDLDRAIHLDPRQAAAYARRAQAWAALCDFGRARANADMAILLDPNNVLGHVMRARMLLARSAFADAVRHLDIAAALDPNHTEALAARGQLYLRRGQAPEAARAFDKALRNDGSNTAALLGRARLLRRTGKSDQAIADVNRVLAADPESDEALVIRAAAHRDAGRLGEALTDCRTAAQYRPQSTRAPIGLALVQLADQDRLGAARSLADAYRINPDAPLVIAAHAYGCLLAGDGVRARAFVVDAQKREPARDTVYLVSGLIDYAAGRLDAALANARAAAQLNPMSVNAKLLTVAAALRLQHHDEALAAAEAALAINPHSAPALLARGKVHEAVRRTADANRDFAAARRLNRTLDTYGPIPVAIDPDD